MRALRKKQQEILPLVEVEDDDPVEYKKAGNAFDLLMDTSTADHSEPESIEEKVEKTIEENVKPAIIKKKKKQKKIVKEELQDVDEAIRYVNEKLGQLPMIQHSEISSKNHKLFLLERKYFDADLELEREFGKMIHSSAKTNRKRGLVTVNKGWPKLAHFGVLMQLIQDPNEGDLDDGVIPADYKEFQLVYSQEYKMTQESFYEAIYTHDPAFLFQVLQKNPCHLDSLLQASEIYKQQGEVNGAIDFISRLLYYLESCFHHSFQITSGKVGVPYDIVENRILHLGIWKHISYLTRKGVWRCCFEFQKLLYSLDRITDPLCSLLYLDIFALKSLQYEWLDEFWTTFNEELGLEHDYPGMCYSIAIAKWELERKRGFNHQVSSDLLKKAINTFPWTCQKIFSTLSLPDPFPNNYSTEGTAIHLIQSLYVEGTESMFKVPELQEFLKETVKSVTDVQYSYQGTFSSKNIPKNIQRLIVLGELTQYYSYLPPGTMDNVFMFDPVPPQGTPKPSSSLLQSIYTSIFGS